LILAEVVYVIQVAAFMNTRADSAWLDPADAEARLEELRNLDSWGMNRYWIAETPFQRTEDHVE
jgi:hypothetical protein